MNIFKKLFFIIIMIGITMNASSNDDDIIDFSSEVKNLIKKGSEFIRKSGYQFWEDPVESGEYNILKIAALDRVWPKSANTWV